MPGQSTVFSFAGFVSICPRLFSFHRETDKTNGDTLNSKNSLNIDMVYSIACYAHAVALKKLALNALIFHGAKTLRHVTLFNSHAHIED